MFNTHDTTRNEFMLHGPLARNGYDWCWHSFTAQDAETGEDKPFFIEFFVCNPALAEDEPVFGQLPDNKASGKKPSYRMRVWGIRRLIWCSILLCEAAEINLISIFMTFQTRLWLWLLRFHECSGRKMNSHSRDNLPDRKQVPSFLNPELP